MEMMWIMCCELYSHQISTHLNTYWRFGSTVLDGALHRHHITTPSEGIFFRRVVFISPVEEYAEQQWSCSGGSWCWNNTLLRHVMSLCPWICPPMASTPKISVLIWSCISHTIPRISQTVVFIYMVTCEKFTLPTFRLKGYLLGRIIRLR